MNYLILLFLFLASTILTYFYIRIARQKNWLDIPNARSSHIISTPRGGGVVFILLWILASLIGIFFDLWTLKQACILLPGTCIIFITGFCDDRYHLSARLRLLFYFLAALISVAALGGFESLTLNQNFTFSLGLFGSVFAVIALIWSTNLFNFMDGLDGLAATEAIFVLGVGGFFLYQSEAHNIAYLIWMLIACVAGFLIWNKPIAKIFMGDAGSASLGFIVMVLALWGEKTYHLPALLWFILYGVFLVDTTLTVVRRLIKKENISQAHRLHAYQRLHQAGYSHLKVLMMIFSVNVVLVGIALVGFYYQAYLFLCALVALIVLVGFYLWIEKKKPMYS